MTTKTLRRVWKRIAIAVVFSVAMFLNSMVVNASAGCGHERTGPAGFDLSQASTGAGHNHLPPVTSKAACCMAVCTYCATPQAQIVAMLDQHTNGMLFWSEIMFLTGQSIAPPIGPPRNLV